MWVSMDFMGCFLGPSIAGLVVEKWGFREATAMCWVSFLIMISMDLIEFHHQKSETSKIRNIRYTELKTDD